MATEDTEESLHYYDEHKVMLEEIVSRPIADVIGELIMLREVARANIVGNNIAAAHAIDRWHKKWGK